MATGSDYNVAVVLINRHEPEGEVAQRLMELADEKGYDSRVVEAQRGEHDVALSFRVPEDVAEAFNADRADRWQEPKVGPDGQPLADDADAEKMAAERDAADNKAASDRAADDDPHKMTPVRHGRAGKA